ncbi:phage tail tube protein [Metabacillus sp. HB246100]
MSFNLMHEYKFMIDTSDGSATPSYVPMAAGFTNATPGNNEQISQDNYLDGSGFSTSDVIGAQQVITFTGHRKFGDVAQDYIFGKTYVVGTARRTKFQFTDPEGTMIECPCTIANIQNFGGDAGAKAEVSVEIHLNGIPTVTPPSGGSTELNY